MAIHFCMLLLTLTSQGFTRVQNQLARLVTMSPQISRGLPLLRSLHWLPARFRILFKINLLTYKTLREKQPVYLHSMLVTSRPSCSLRSNKDNSLSVPRVKTNTGARAFHSSALSLWNNLLLSVHSAISVATFKKYLKTHCGAGISERVSALDWLSLSLRYAAIITLSVSNPGLCT